MKKPYFIFFFLSICLTILAQNQPPLYKDPNQPYEKRATDLLKRMTLNEKVNQLVSSYPTYIKENNGTFILNEVFKNAICDGLGSVQLQYHQNNASEDVQLLNQIQKIAIEKSRLGIPILMAGEALHGLVAYKATSYPMAIALAATWSPDLVQKVFERVALEARTRGFHLAFSPLLDVSRDPRWGRMDETYGEDTYLVTQMGLSAVRGLQGGKPIVGKENIVSSPKHFVGYAQCDGGRNFAPTNITERLLMEDYLEPFRQVVTNAYAWGIMPSHSEIDGIPCHGSEQLLTQVLRKEWNFKGIVVSDYFDIERLNTLHHVAATNEEAAIMALKAGVNLDQPSGRIYETLKKTLQQNPQMLKYLNERVLEVLRVKFMLGLFENAYSDEKIATTVCEDKANKELALKAGEKAIILLKNEHNILPLDKSKLKTIALIGPNANQVILGGYSPSHYQAVSILEGLKSYLKDIPIEVNYAQGCDITKEKSASQFEIAGYTSERIHTIPYEEEKQKIEEAVALALKSDVTILCLGDNYYTSREAIFVPGNLGDRANLDLVGNQNALAKAIIETGKPLIVYLMHGRSLSINYIADKAAAILDGWYLGEETGNVVARTLFGENNPGGKLPVTIPRSVGQLPVYYSQRTSGTLKQYLFENSSPLFHFGYGKSYTNFQLKNINLSSTSIKAGENCEVTLDIENTGKVIGDEVVQVYVKDVVASVSRPSMSLKAFQRVTLNSGETQKIKLKLGKEAFEMIDIDYKRVIESGEFKILVGTSSRAEDLKILKLSIY